MQTHFSHPPNLLSATTIRVLASILHLSNDSSIVMLLKKSRGRLKMKIKTEYLSKSSTSNS